MKELINYKAVCRTAPATPGLLNTVGLGEILPVEVSCLCRLVIYTDNDFLLNLGFN